MSNIVVKQINGGPTGVINAIINGNFGINQRGVSGTVTLASGVYGHDRWKAGASGCTYTFATVDNVTTLTISAGTLIQVIEGLNLSSGTYTLSFAGTAQGKIGAGSFAGSGVTGAAVGGTNLNIEFNTGTVSLVQFELGSVATPFERRPFGAELGLCQRYFEKSFNQTTAPAENVGFLAGALVTSGTSTATQTLLGYATFAAEKRTAPTVTTFNPFAAGSGWSQGGALNLAAGVYGVGTRAVGIRVNGTPTLTNTNHAIHWTASAEL